MGARRVFEVFSGVMFLGVATLAGLLAAVLIAKYRGGAARIQLGRRVFAAPRTEAAAALFLAVYAGAAGMAQLVDPSGATGLPILVFPVICLSNGLWFRGFLKGSHWAKRR